MCDSMLTYIESLDEALEDLLPEKVEDRLTKWITSDNKLHQWAVGFSVALVFGVIYLIGSWLFSIFKDLIGWT